MKLRVVEIQQSILRKNDGLAADLRDRFARSGTFVVNLFSSPSSGLTTLLEAARTDPPIETGDTDVVFQPYDLIQQRKCRVGMVPLHLDIAQIGQRLGVVGIDGQLALELTFGHRRTDAISSGGSPSRNEGWVRGEPP